MILYGNRLPLHRCGSTCCARKAGDVELASEPQSIIAEAISALRGLGALIAGDRDARRYFNLTPAGFVTTLIVSIGLLLLQALAKVMAMGINHAGLAADLIEAALLYAYVLAAMALFLRMIGRSQVLLPLMVVQNWATIFSNVLALILLLGGLSPLLAGLGLLLIFFSVRVMSIIAQLNTRQIVGFFAYQIVVVLLLAVVLLAMFPPSDGELAQLSSLPL